MHVNNIITKGAFLIIDVVLIVAFVQRLFTTTSLAEMFTDAVIVLLMQFHFTQLY